MLCFFFFCKNCAEVYKLSSNVSVPPFTSQRIRKLDNNRQSKDINSMWKVMITYCGSPLWSLCPGSTTPPQAPANWWHHRPPPPSHRGGTPAVTEHPETSASLKDQTRRRWNSFFIFSASNQSRQFLTGLQKENKKKTTTTMLTLTVLRRNVGWEVCKRYFKIDEWLPF